MKKKEQAERTRNAIIDVAKELIHSNGFRTTSINDIIDQLGITKGAFFHHFKNKKELGFAIIEYWRQTLYERWVKPLETSTDPLTDLYMVPYDLYGGYTITDLKKGCPLANLAMELSPIDEDYRERINAIYAMLEDGAEKALIRGQEIGVVSKDVDTVRVARFYEELMAGTRSVAKNTLDKERLLETLETFREYLETKR